jgi:hypothetical protein
VKRTRPAFILSWLLAFAALAAPAQAESEALAAAVKATYLYKLAPFISWPPSVFNAPDDPLVICVQGPETFAVLVDRAAAGQRVGAHAVQVRRLGRIDRSSGCQIAYLAGSPAQSASQALTAVQGAPVLTVTDAERGPARGVVHFVLAGGKVRFAVNNGLAEADGINISSKLLALAVEVAR